MQVIIVTYVALLLHPLDYELLEGTICVLFPFSILSPSTESGTHQAPKARRWWQWCYSNGDSACDNGGGDGGGGNHGGGRGDLGC